MIRNASIRAKMTREELDINRMGRLEYLEDDDLKKSQMRQKKKQLEINLK